MANNNNNNNLTIFQKLGQVLGPYGVKQKQTQRYNIGSNEILKTDNKAEFDKAKLQAQQNKYLGQTWKKVESGLFQQSINYETTRIGSYSDFEAMEFYPTIAAALDVMMEESTTLNDNGRMLNIYSDSKRVKGILEDLFFNRLDLHTSLPMFTRNTCKYGDNFVYLNIDEKNGIIGAKQMPNYEMERRDVGLFDMISGRESVNSQEALSTSDKVKFFWRGRDVEFNSWQIAHFRLLGDDRRLPYGTCLKGDTRVNTEFGVEEISEIEVGTRVWSFNTKTQEKELSPILDKIMSGTKEVFKISTRHNYVDASKEHRILVALKSGEFIYKNVNELKLGDLLVINQKEKTNKLIKINKTTPINNKNGWFNDIDLIPDFVNEEIAQLFGFLIGDGWIPKHNNSVDFALGVDEETNKFYINLLEKYSGKKTICDDKQVKCNSKLLKTILERLGFIGKSYEKRIPKWVFEMETDLQKAFVSGLIDADGWITKDKWTIAIHIELNNKALIEDLKILLQRIGYKSGSIRSRIRKTPIIKGRQIKKVKESHMITFFDKNLNQMIVHDMNGRLNYEYVLEPIQSIESIGEFETYDIYVENENHNFYANNIVVHNSILEKSRRVWKQLLLSEDSMLVYRVTRAPERRVYKIYVGNIDDADVEQYVNTIADRFKRMPIVDPQTGQMDLRYNQLSNDQDYFIPVRTENAPNPIDTLPGACIALDTRIPLLDGRVLELNQIIKEWDNGNRNLWVYSCNPNTGELAPGMITWAGETRKNTEVIKITLDNGESITTTPDHKWVYRTKGFVEAKDLRVGESLMPFYRDRKKIKSNTNGDYERIWDSAKQEWVFTHRMVTDLLNDFNVIENFTFNEKYSNEIKNIRHHKDHNRFNNNPNNLVWMNGADHMKYHQSVIMETIWYNPEENIKKITKGINEYIFNLSEEDRISRGEQSKLNSINSRDKAIETFNNNTNKKEIIINRGKSISVSKSTKEFKEKFSEIAKSNWESNEYRNKVFSKRQTLTFTDELYTMFLEMFKLYGKADLTLNELNKSNDFMNEFINSNKDIRSSLTNLNEFTHKHLEKMLKEKGFKNYRDWCKVISEELGYKNVRAWRYFIENNNKEKSLLYNHKIISIEWLENKIDTGTITVDGNELYHNYHTFATESGVFIKNSNLDQIADIEYLQKNLFTSLRVPKPFLGFEEATGDGKNLAIQDIRFSRTINRIQQSMLQELNKIAIIHLYILGFEEELDNFTLTLNNPSTQAEMLKVEHTQLKVTLYKDAVSDSGNGFGTMSMTRAKREILGWSDDDIKQDLLEQRMEKAAAAELLNSSAVIKHTGMFDVVDRIYGDYKLALNGGGGEGEKGEGAEPSAGGGGGGLGGSFGGGGVGGEDLDFGDETATGGEEEGSATAEAGAEAGAAEVGAEAGAAEVGAEAPVGGEAFAESIKKADKLLMEHKIKLTNKLKNRKDKYQGKFVDLLMESIKPDVKNKEEKIKIYDKNIKVNENIDSMIGDIDKMLND